MGVQYTFGTDGATGGGWATQPGTLQPTYEERWAEPKWSWQQRAPKTWRDRNWWSCLWSFGCRVSGGNLQGYAVRDLAGKDVYEPFSCDGEGSPSMNFLKGTCFDAIEVPVDGAIVQAFVTATDAFAGEVQANADGTYTLGVQQLKTTQHYLVAYKAGSPDIFGTTVNTLTPTNVDGTTTGP